MLGFEPAVLKKIGWQARLLSFCRVGITFKESVQDPAQIQAAKRDNGVVVDVSGDGALRNFTCQQFHFALKVAYLAKRRVPATKTCPRWK